MRQLYKIGLLCSLSLLAACSSTTLSQQQASLTAEAAKITPTWPQRQQELAGINAWQLQGAIGIQQNNKASSASFNWKQQSTNYYSIRLYGPFGAGAVQIQGQPGSVTLTSNDHPQPVTANNPQALIAKETGWQLPVGELYYWVRGLPAPSTAAKTKLDSQNRLSELSQDGWQVEYVNYARINHMDLPSKITLRNSQFAIKLVIKQWLVLGSSS